MTEPVVNQPSLATRGTVTKSHVTAVLTVSGSWIAVLPGSFDTCEINFYDDVSARTVGGVLGFRFLSKGMNGRRSLMLMSMATVAAVQIEEPEEAENNGK